MISVIQAAANFLIAQKGQKPRIEQRKSLAATIVKLFAKLKVDEVLKKLDQRMKNVLRTVKEKNPHNGVKAETNADKNVPDENLQDALPTDYDDLVKPHNVFATTCTIDEDYLDDERNEDENQSDYSQADEEYDNN